MKITAQEEFGLRCLLAIRRHQDGGTPVPISTISQAEGISVEYAGKLLGQLRRAGLVTSTRGKRGGYVLARPASEVSLLDVVQAFSGGLFELESCRRFRGHGRECVHIGDCGMRPVWTTLTSLISTLMGAITLEALAASEADVAAGLQSRLLQELGNGNLTVPAPAKRSPSRPRA